MYDYCTCTCMTIVHVGHYYLHVYCVIDYFIISLLQGISCLPDLQYLSFGENHLPSLVGIEECPVLQCVNLQQNNLQMVRIMNAHAYIHVRVNVCALVNCT